jgi:Methyltransferase FkbM domain
VREHAADGLVDYVKVDIEGGERELLQDRTGWASRIRAIKVEVHPPYTCDACEEDLTRLGFETRVDPRHRACVEGVRLG